MTTGGGTTKQQSTQQSTSSPYAPTQPYIDAILPQASSLYDQASQNTSYAPFNTVVQPSATTQQGLALTAQRALNGSPVTGAADNFLTNFLQAKTPPPGSSTLQSLLGGPDMAGNATLQAGANGDIKNAASPLAAFFAGQNPSSNPSAANLGSMASGGEINPYLNGLYSAASKPVIDSINAQFGAAGRTGSGANQQLLTRDLGDLSSNIFGTGYQQAIQNQLNANSQVQGAYDNAAGRNLTATGLLGQYSGQDNQNRLQSAQDLNAGNLSAYGAKAGVANDLNSAAATQNAQQLQGAQLAPSLANNDYADLQNLLNVGGAQDAQSASQIQDLLTRWQYGQQQPWNLLNNYSGLLTGYAGLGGQASGSSSGTATQPGQSLIPSLIGAGATAASMLSDREAKRDIRRIGTYANGLPMYSFQYKTDRRRHHVGVMAQDVIKVKPEAVTVRPDGYMAVNYELALAA